MEILFDREVAPGRRARVVMTDRSDGNYSVLQDVARVEVVRRRGLDRAGVARGDWTWLHQVHGREVVTVRRPGEHAGARADAAVTTVADAVLVAQVADCVPIAFVAEVDSRRLLTGAAANAIRQHAGTDPVGAGVETAAVVAVAHAGWRGLADGIVEATVNAARAVGATDLTAIVGASIGPECYEFAERDLAKLRSQFGEEVAARTTSGTPAMHMANGVRAELRRLGVARVIWRNPCTGCEADRYWSYRSRGDTERQAMFVVLSESPSPGGPK